MSDIPNYDQWKLHNPNDGEVFHCTCDECGYEIYEGQEMYEIQLNGDRIHEYCFESYCMDGLGAVLYVAGETFK